VNQLLINANSLHIPLADNSVQLCVTSPPYYLQRDYLTAKWDGGDSNCNHRVGRFEYPVNEKQLSNTGSAGHQARKICPKCGAVRVDQQLGLEDIHDCFGWATGNPCGECFVCHLTEVFREIKRVLRPDGTLYLNLGDTYNGSGGAGGDYNKNGFREGQERYRGAHVDSFKDKDLLCVPHSVAMALREDGWWLRATIPWIKKNAYVDGGARDRPATKIEYIFMLTKSKNYYYDRFATLVPYTTPMNRWGGATMKDNSKSEWAEVTGDKLNRHRYMRPNEEGRLRRPSDWFYDSLKAVLEGEDKLLLDENTNPMAISVKTKPSGVPHYATFPPALVRPLILASTSEMGCCEICHNPIERKVLIDGKQQVRWSEVGNGPYREGDTVNVYQTQGWEKNCNCDTQETVPCIVLDPFCGVSTTGIVSSELGRRYIGIDLSREYLNTGLKRMSKLELPLFAEMENK
jgi:DNA modification methylase